VQHSPKIQGGTVMYQDVFKINSFIWIESTILQLIIILSGCRVSILVAKKPHNYARRVATVQLTKAPGLLINVNMQWNWDYVGGWNTQGSVLIGKPQWARWWWTEGWEYQTERCLIVHYTVQSRDHRNTCPPEGTAKHNSQRYIFMSVYSLNNELYKWRNLSDTQYR